MRAEADEACNGIGCFVDGISDAVTGTVSFFSDPFGSTFKALQEAASGLAKDVLPALTQATLPDLTAEWFVRAYAIAFAAGIFFAVVLLIPQILRTARGTMAGRDLLESVGVYFPMFLVGAMFGPAFGVLLVNFFHALSDVFIEWGISGNYSETITRMQAMIDSTDPAGLTGGVFVACILMLCMVAGLFLVVLMLIVQLVTLYFTGVLVPFALAWVIDPTRRSFGYRIVLVWVGILAAHPALFFLLGFAYSIMSTTIVTLGQNDPLQTLVTFIVALLALFIASLSPLLLLKFAPILPTGLGSTNGPSLNEVSIGAPNLTEAGTRYGLSTPDDDHSTPRTTQVNEPDLQPASGGLSDIAATRAGTEEPGHGPARTSTPGTPGPPGPAGAAGATGEAGSAAGTGSLGAPAAAEAAEGGALGAESLAAAGAAESATGAGAVIGVPTLLAAGAAAAADKARELGNTAAEQAVAPMPDQPTEGEQP